MKNYTLVYITTPNKKLALKLGKACLEEKLVACVNIIDKVTALYEWEGKLCQEKECILIMKTIQKNSAKIIKNVKALHSNSCPCIVTLPITDGNEQFLDWISKSL